LVNPPFSRRIQIRAAIRDFLQQGSSAWGLEFGEAVILDISVKILPLAALHLYTSATFATKSTVC
jgi:hypothetical protein